MEMVAKFCHTSTETPTTMTSKLVLCLALTALTAQCAVVRNEESLKRSARSPCPTCGPPPPPPPTGFPPPPTRFPPPPPFFRTQNWSGVARSRDGSQQGVFSGAAAAYGDAHPSGEAYSLASAAGSGQGDQQQIQRGGFEHSHYSQQSYGSHGGYSSQNQGGKLDNDLQQHQQSGFESSSKAQSSAFAAGHGGFHSQNSASQDQHKLQSGGNVGEGFLYSGQNQVGGQQKPPSSFASNAQISAYSGNAVNKKQGYGGSFNQHVEQAKDQQKIQSGFGSASNAESSAYSGSANQYGASTQQKDFGQRGDQGQDQQKVTQGFGSNTGVSGYTGNSNIHHELSGALILAKQGLQSAQQTDSGCTTCGKSSYALSNAKSNSGSAVAISVGG